MNNRKIMIVDDDTNICELLRLYIEKEGYSTVIANDGEQAVELFNREQPNLILLDIRSNLRDRIPISYLKREPNGE